MTPAASDSWSIFLRKALIQPSRLIRNADVSVEIVEASIPVPLVVNHAGHAATSWVASLRNSYGPYARAETDLVQMSRWIQPLYLAGSHAAEELLRTGGLAGGYFLNNWLLATNLYEPAFDAEVILKHTEVISQRKPAMPVVVRSLTGPLHGPLLTRLAAEGFLLLPSRQVWLVAEPGSGEWRRHRDSRRDLALLEQTRSNWTWVEGRGFSDADYATAHRHFQRLYRGRYPVHNPDYTETFFRECVRTGFMDIHGLRRNTGGDLSGVIGMVHNNRQSCTPLLGYDLDAPVETGLYRLLTLRALLTCEARQSLLHCSAGAGRYKANRGAQSSVEFAAVWANHLPLYRRASLRTLSAAVMKWVVPYLENHQL